MTTKQYLQQIYQIHRRVRRLQAQREQIRAELYSVGSPAGKMDADKVQTSLSGDTMLRLIAKVDEVERGIVAEMEELLELQHRITREIEQLPNEQQRDVLFQRYVLFKKWEQIAVDMNYTIRRVYQLHGEALESFKHCIVFHHDT